MLKSYLYKKDINLKIKNIVKKHMYNIIQSLSYHLVVFFYLYHNYFYLLSKVTK